MIGLVHADRLSPAVRAELEQLVIALRGVRAVDLAGYDVTAVTTFLREDGTFATAGLTQAQVLARASFRG